MAIDTKMVTSNNYNSNNRNDSYDTDIKNQGDE